MSLLHYNWTRKALLPVVVAWITATVIIIQLAISFREQLSGLSLFWLSFIPLHIAAFLTVMFVLSKNAPKGEKKKALNLESPGTGTRIALLLLSGVFLMPLVAAVAGITMKLYDAVFGYEPPVSPILEFLQANQTPVAIISVAVAAVIIAPLTEEVIFRLVLYESFSSFRLRYPAFITSFLFAVMHQVPVQIPALFVVGLVLQYLRRRYNSLWAPIIVHSAYNAASLAALIVILYRA